MMPPLSSNSGADQVAVSLTTLPAASAIEALGGLIAALAPRRRAATYALMLLLREFGSEGGRKHGSRSWTNRLRRRTGTGGGVARAKKRLAKALAQLRRRAEVMRRRG